jgi:predicted amino acid dehydrogenase
MAIDTDVNTETNTITRTVLGKLNTAFIKGMNAIWDLTQADVSNISTHDIMDLIKHIQKGFDKRGTDFKVAIVAPGDLSYGVSKIFEGHGTELPVSIRVMRNRKEADVWINQADE